MKKLILAFVTALAFSAPAFAGQCPADMAKIDEAMSTAELSEADSAKVQELRQMGEEQHESGDHAASVATLAEAKAILGIE